MYRTTLEVLCKLRGLSQADLSRMAGVSRQAVSLWFKSKEPKLNVQSKHLENLSKALEIKIDSLLDPLPFLNLNTWLLWDRLYPSVEDFGVALVKGELRALARLVESYGLFKSANLMGKIIWKKFLNYKKFIPPVRRKQCETLCRILQNHNLV